MTLRAIHDVAERNERRKAEQALRDSEERYRTLFYDNPNPMWVYDLETLAFLAVNDAAVSHYGYTRDEFLAMTIKDIRPPGDIPALLRNIQETRRPLDISPNWRHCTKDGRLIDVEITSHELVWSGRRARLVLVNDITERKRAEEQTQQHLKRLGALRAIDVAISGSVDLRVTLNILLEQAVTQLNVDAADVLLLNPEMGVLEFAAGRGFRSRAIERSRVRLGEGLSGHAALERRLIAAPNLAESPYPFVQPELLTGEGFVTYYSVPLITKGQVTGALEIFHRVRLEPPSEWLQFLEALAGQAAIAIDNATLFQRMQHSNLELALAYDRTIEGWSRALDLRDKETEGHTQRVTELTLHLAQEFGIRDAELVHIRRGGLLHDIGKMGVPDGILLKPGPLTECEWDIMRRHPVYAYELLSPIEFLRPALDIPYCHHEKWDGTGYPRGLKCEQIPLAARIFAVVDVWDALRSDRPYRPAWPEEQALEHIRTLPGKHFDPQVVKAFLKLLAAA